MRLSGLASGMDTDLMVSEMMKAERLKLDKFGRSKQTDLWKQAEYQKVNKNIANFILNSQKNMGLKKTASTGLMINQSYKTLDYMRIAKSSNVDIANVKVTSKAQNGTFKIEINEIPEGSYETVKVDDLNVKHTDELRIGDVVVYEGASENGEGITTKELIKMINNNKDLKEKGVSAFYDNGTKSLFIQGDAGLNLSISAYEKASTSEKELKLNANGELEEAVVISGVEFEEGKKLSDITEYFKDDKFVDIKDKGNGKVEISERSRELKTDNVLVSPTETADYHNVNGEDVLKTELTIGGKIFAQGTKVEEIKSEMEEIGYVVSIKDGKMSFYDSKDKGIVKSEGKTGSATINGVEFENLTSDKLIFNGIEIELKKVGNSTITVDTNYDEIVDRIKELVDSYNTLLDDISKDLGQKRYKDYHPLSTEEKSAMKENDVKLWEEKAKSGLLNNDETLKRMLNNTRSDMYKTVRGLEGSFNHITQIGITTEKYAKGTTGGKLQIDEKKLREALAEDADGVMELLFGKGKEENLADGKDKLDSGETFNGIFTGIYDNMVNSMKDVITKSGPGEDSELLRNVRSNILIDFVSYKGSISDLDRSIMNMEKKMADMEVLLARKEDGYYKKFTAMEKGLQKMQSQSSWIGQQMM